MVTKLKRIGSTLVVILLTYYTVQGLGYLTRTRTIDWNTDAIKAFHSVEENTVEVLAIGSSHVHRGIKPMSMYSNYGIGAYAYTAAGQKGNQTVLYLKDALLTQKPKVVLIETFMVEKNNNQSEPINYKTLIVRSIDTLEGKIQYLKEAYGTDLEKYFSYFFNIFAFHERWEDLAEFSFKESASYKKYQKSMGYRITKNTKKVKIPEYGSVKQKDFSDNLCKNLNEIVTICNENDIDIIFFTTPSEQGYHYEDAMEKYAGENGCAYIDFFKLYDELELDGDTDFSDEDHLNDKGAEKISDYLGRYLSENYELTDMRTVEGNIWQQQLDK